MVDVLLGDETIFALSSGAGRAGVAVVRVSGPEAGIALTTLAGSSLLSPRHAVRVKLREPRTGEPIDNCLAIWFPGPGSYTGEDVAEFHVHGGHAVVGGLMDALAAQPALRPAEPGEFTRRAFLNGKLDLTEAEGLADLVNAETAMQRHQALRQMGGELGRLYDGWRGQLVQALAHIEAEIDFPDEDLPEDIAEHVKMDISQLYQSVSAHLSDDRHGEILREGLYVAILGAPNVGKSSLLNCLARRDAAIVSETAGTTRDVIEVHMDLNRYPVILADTAGLREVADTVESEGVRRALARASAADVKVVVFDATAWPKLAPAAEALVDRDAIAVVNKCDLAAVTPPLDVAGQPAHPISARTGAGVEALLESLGREVARRLAGGAGPALTRARHRRAVAECASALERAVEGTRAELVAEDLRLAVRALGRITGRVDVEDLLDVIFRDFCIGK